MRPGNREHPNAGSWISLSISVAIHLALSIVLSWIAIEYSGRGLQGFLLTGTQLSEDSETESPSLEITSPSSLSDISESVELTVSKSESVPLASALVAISSSSPATAPSLTSTSFQETHLALGLDGTGEDIDGRGGGPTRAKFGDSGATFFGTRASGQRFVFVIDSSTSMIGPRWDALRRELIRAIRSLSYDQEFFVISFDTIAHPMLNDFPPAGKFLTPTSENLERVNRWIGSIRHGNSTLPAQAIGIALRLEPDAIFLLSDGEIRDATLYDLRFYNRAEDSEGEDTVRVPIHTVLLDSEVGYLTLKAIADENEGVFTPVGVYPK